MVIQFLSHSDLSPLPSVSLWNASYTTSYPATVSQLGTGNTYTATLDASALVGFYWVKVSFSGGGSQTFAVELDGTNVRPPRIAGTIDELMQKTSMETGLYAITLAVNGTGNSPIAGAAVTVKQAGQNVRWGRTNNSGAIVFGLGIGSYTVSVSATGFVDVINQAFTVAADATVSIQMVAGTVTPPSVSGMCAIAAKILRSNVAVAGCRVTVKLEDQKSAIPEGVLLQSVTSFVTDQNGEGVLVLPWSSEILHGSGVYRLEVTDPANNNNLSHSRRFVVPDLTNANLSELASP